MSGSKAITAIMLMGVIMEKDISRRTFFHKSMNTIAAFALGGITTLALSKANKDYMVWQIDPYKCIQCEKCSTHCVKSISAVKCVHAFDVCGYCNLCGGYYQAEAKNLDTAAENQLCPTGAIKRKFIEDPYYEYTIDEELCIGCSKCVKGCGAFGNGSLFLQIRQNLCLNCNECAIAKVCPAKAFKRVPSSKPYILKGDNNKKA